MSDRLTPIDEQLARLARTSDIEVAAHSLDAVLGRTGAPEQRRAPRPLYTVLAEHVRERRLAERDADTGLKGPLGLTRKLRQAFRECRPPRVPLLVRIRFVEGVPSLDIVTALASALLDNVSRADLVARSAPDELAVLMVGVDPRHAPSIRARLERVGAEAVASGTAPTRLRVACQVLHDPEVLGPLEGDAGGDGTDPHR